MEKRWAYGEDFEHVCAKKSSVSAKKSSVKNLCVRRAQAQRLLRQSTVWSAFLCAQPAYLIFKNARPTQAKYAQVWRGLYVEWTILPWNRIRTFVFVFFTCFWTRCLVVKAASHLSVLACVGLAFFEISTVESLCVHRAEAEAPECTSPPSDKRSRGLSERIFTKIQKR